jgi:thiosulfate dehydrogenase
VRTFIIGILLGILLVCGGVYFYFMNGLAPVATSAPPLPFENMLANGALHARIRKEMPKDVPIPWDETNLTAGAEIYKQDCAVCHGLPGQDQTAIAKGMFPKPPKLMEGTGVTDDPPQETYWKVQNGIRLTGMPGFHDVLTAQQMWQVTLLLANANKLPQKAKDALSTTQAPNMVPNNGPGN